MKVGVLRETLPGESRVALVPESLPKLTAQKIDVIVQADAGEAAGFPDETYEAKGASVAQDPISLLSQCEVVLKVRPPLADEVNCLKPGTVLISFLYPAAHLDTIKQLASRKISAFAMDLMPRISRAQPMDALSSQATVAGYKAVLLAAESLPRFFPMLMTAAGTIPPAKVFVIGAGVAGLQAIATARRLGAVVEAYDVRPVVKEQIESLGARYVSMDLEAEDAEDKGGYAKAQSEEFYRRQQEFLAKQCQGSDVVITTALVPGSRAPLLITEEAVKGMRTGSVIVDLAAEQEGNCACTEPGKTAVVHGITIHGPLNLPSTLAPHASQMYARNVTSFLSQMVKDGVLNLNLTDELIKGPLVTHDGQIVHEPTRLSAEKV
ncbi:MAG: NAD(P) transhydrogenase subunit alpha [Candidatus Glassbacteria bacterium RBG_16_58_8]|uniref:NAD(P) transhydrogenase subunit alpha part 1 n=1 Tax=Candidatus Glassbacteria bacterium RBG_16_58_8 TaxID=1817866 RepID=A0A1F5YC67_9BACT|nr:MAG: NAD(P) transhydrogenase subunit alpha [Candidatus Glassbacteria bacterium RBG_16_58_8]